ncbi:MAG: PrsW family glutamic-type intramembrane protease [Patescibacteria group bacterium]
MLENPLFLLGVSTIFAAIPVGIWFYVFLKKEEKSKKTIAFIFFLGCLTAPALLGIQYAWDIFPQFNLARFIEDNISSQNTMFVATFVLFGGMEEIIKHYVVKQVDKRTLLINKINDAIKYSVTAALGFSFVENVYYLYQWWPVISNGELIGMYIFRSIFTSCAHMIFSGIFGYYYGVSKFSIVINKQQELTGKTKLSDRIISKLFGVPLSESYREKTILKGLTIAIVMHAIHNYLLQFNFIPPVIIFDVLGYLYLRYLLVRKAGHLLVNEDLSIKHKSTMAKKDEDVVLELLAMWFQDKRYVDVIHICERLLERDPDNSVVQLFKARALDSIDEKDTYKKILNTVIKTKKDLSQNDKNIISKYTVEKEMLKKVQAMVKDQLKKQGKEFIEQATKLPMSPQTPQQSTNKDVLQKYTGDGTFKL